MTAWLPAWLRARLSPPARPTYEELEQAWYVAYDAAQADPTPENLRRDEEAWATITGGTYRQRRTLLQPATKRAQVAA